MTNQQCCEGGASSPPFPRRAPRTVATLIPGAALFVIPKCPMCLAIWLTAATGIGFSEAGLEIGGVIAFACWVACLACLIARRAFRKAPYDSRFDRC